MLLAAFSRRKLVEAYKTRLSYDLALLSNSALTADSFKSLQKSAAEQLRQIMRQLFPWQKQEYVESRKREFDRYRKEYTAAFGIDPAEVNRMMQEIRSHDR